LCEAVYFVPTTLSVPVFAAIVVPVLPAQPTRLMTCELVLASPAFVRLSDDPEKLVVPVEVPYEMPGWSVPSTLMAMPPVRVPPVVTIVPFPLIAAVNVPLAPTAPVGIVSVETTWSPATHTGGVAALFVNVTTPALSADALYDGP
jgi:hypothetical protein